MTAERQYISLALGVLTISLLGASAAAKQFTIAVIPDTQNYIDFTHQKAAGYPLDGASEFLDQMRYIADHAESRDGDIAFAIGLGDMWQHGSVPIDPEHVVRGFLRRSNAKFDAVYIRPEARSFELPLVAKGYTILADRLPFSAVPGNHDYDAQFGDATYPPDSTIKGEAKWGSPHVGGLDNFRSVFGPQSDLLKDKPWFVGRSPSGGDSAELFEAGGYRFLQISLQFDPPNASFAWAASILKRYPGLPTIVSTHSYLSPSGERTAKFDPDVEDNIPEVVWQKLISQYDQIFLVLSGHICAQGNSVAINHFGHRVDQILSDYQCRGQALKDAGVKDDKVGLGDGWLRLMQFDLDGAVPTIHVRTYSTYYKAFSTDLPAYAQWYKKDEWPGLSDADFLAKDDFTIRLDDFRERFTAAKAPAAR